MTDTAQSGGLLARVLGVLAGLFAPKKPAEVPAPVLTAAPVLDPLDLAAPLVKEAEGLRLNAYLCPAGLPTIGWGHTRGVRLGQAITRDQAEVYLREDMAEALAIVDRAVKVSLSAHQRAALASFVFNVGPGKVGVKDGFVTLKSGEPSTMLRLLNAGRHTDAVEQFPAWTKATVKGKRVELPGLVKRRAAERALFLTPD